MDLIFSAALSSITLTIYLFKKNTLEELKKTKPFPYLTNNGKKSLEEAEKILDKNVTYYLEGIVSPIKEGEIISCANSKKKTVILKSIIKRHTVKWSSFWKDWLPEVEVISINGKSVPFNIVKYQEPQVTIPKLSVQDVMLVDLPIISDNYINQDKKSIVKSIMDYVNGERFSGIENMEKGFAIGEPITVVGKFKLPEPTPTVTPDIQTPVKTDVIDISPSPPLEPEEILVQSTNLPVLVTEFGNEDVFCILSSKTFKEIVKEESKETNKWKWIFIGSTTVIGGVIAFRIWRYYRKKRRAEELQARQNNPPSELERLQAAAYIPQPRNPSVFDILRDIVNWLLVDDYYDYDPNVPPHIPYTPISEYIPEPIPIPEDEAAPSSSENISPPTNSTAPSAPSAPSAPPESSTSPGGETTSPTTDENVCVVCLTEKREYAFLPCRHLCVCHNCVHYLEKCPLCRSPITSYIKIFS